MSGSESRSKKQIIKDICEKGESALNIVKRYLGSVLINENEIQENDDDGLNWIHYCTLSDNLYCLKYFIEEKRVNINLQTTKETCLHFAVEFGHFEIVLYLLQQGADLDIEDYENLLPENRSSQSLNSERIKELIEERRSCSNLEEFIQKDFSKYSPNNGPYFTLPIEKREKIKEDFRNKYFESITKDSIFRSRNEEIKRLKEENDKLQKDVTEIRSKNDSLTSQKSDLEFRFNNENRRFRIVQQKKNQEIEKLRRENDEVKKSHELAKKVLNDCKVTFEKKEESWAENINKHLEKIDELEQTILLMKEEKRVFERDLESVKEEKEGLDDENKELNEQIEELEEKIGEFEINYFDPNEDDVSVLQENIDKNYDISSRIEEQRREENRKMRKKISDIHKKRNKELEEQKEKAEDEIICTICFDRNKNTVLNCGHRFCGVCAWSFMNDRCPICKEPITERRRTYN